MRLRSLAFCLGVFIFISSRPAAAERTVVASGEHQGFSRLVIDTGTVVPWSVSHIKDLAVINIEQPSLTLDLSEVFDRLSKLRVSDVRQDSPGSALEITLNCKCVVSGFYHKKKWLVVDIRDADQTESIIARSIGVRSRLSSNVGDVRLRYSFRFSEQEGWERSLWGANIKKNRQFVHAASDGGHDDVVEQRSSEISNIAEATFQNIGEFFGLEAEILNGLSDMQTLSLSLGNPGDAASQYDQIVRPTPRVGMIKDNESESGYEVLPLTVVMLSDDQVNSDTHGSGDEQCLDGRWFSINQWANGDSFSRRISEVRGRISGDFDSVGRNDTLDLARAYLFFGFGAEARSILRLSQSEGLEERSLYAIAGVIDLWGSKSRSYSVLRGQESCSSDVALWSVLSHPSSAGSSNIDSVLQSFGRLPVHLRAQVGARLAQIYLDVGEEGTAEIILRGVDRGVVGVYAGADVVKSNLDERKGNSESAESRRIGAMENSDEKSPLAIVGLVESAFLAGRTISPEVGDLAASYFTQFLGSDMEGDLRRANILAWAMLGRPREAASLLQRKLYVGQSENFARDLASFLEILTERGSDIDFLSLSLNSIFYEDVSLPTKVGDGLAERLIGLGFFSSAAHVLAVQSGAVSVERRILRAEAALGQELPREALVALLGIEEPYADELRGRAMMQLDRYDQAVEYLSRTKNSTELDRSIWLSEGGVDGASGSNSVYEELIRVAGSVTEGLDDDGDFGPLARARAKMSDSSKTRDEIVKLLDLLGDSE